MIHCALCGAETPQDFNPKKGETEEGEEEKTMRAAQVNGQGPFCQLCRHLEMALRYAEHRKLYPVVAHIKLAQDGVTKI